MLKLARAEQVTILAAIQRYPDEKHLGGWLSAWVKAQVEAGTSAGIDITLIPFPTTPGEYVRRTAGEIAELFEKVGYADLPTHQRKAVQKFRNATVEKVEETEKLAEKPECWFGDHRLDDDEYDEYLWVVTGQWSKDNSFRKWGCGACADLIYRTHPESEKHDLGV